jgi:hypothetical protein
MFHLQSESKMAAYSNFDLSLLKLLFLVLCFFACSVFAAYKLKDLEFNFKPGDPLPEIFTADTIAEYDGSDVSGRVLLPLVNFEQMIFSTFAFMFQKSIV